MTERLLRGFLLAGYSAALITGALCDMRQRVQRISADHILPTAVPPPDRFTAIVLGCRVNDDDPSRCLEERLVTALRLYTTGRVKRLLLSGDHGTRNYDEVNTMRSWFVSRGVPLEHIFLDHAGFDTYDTMVRARKVFDVHEALVISQAFHLPRAVYLARSVGIDAVGMIADPPGGSACAGSAFREPLACAKAVMNVLLRSDPKFLGPEIPITGSPVASFDQAEIPAR